MYIILYTTHNVYSTGKQCIKSVYKYSPASAKIQ